MELPGSVHQLAVFRILLGLQILYSANTKLFQLVQQVPDTAHTKNIFPPFINQWVDNIAIPYLQPITMVLGIFLVLGLFTRYILPLLFVSFILLFSFYYSRHNAPHPWLHIWFPLLLLNFTLCSDALSLDKIFGIINPLPDQTATAYRWPMEAIAGWLAYIYVAAGLAKLLPVYKAWKWLDGGTSQELLYNRFLNSIYFYLFKRPLFDYTQYHWLFTGLSIGSLVIELSCIMIFFTQRFHRSIIIMLFVMHFFLYFIGVLGFMQLGLLLCISLISPAFFAKLFKEKGDQVIGPNYPGG
jgi:uncharacterized membrane protein YphA (DoxX/SURF4 family)